MRARAALGRRALVRAPAGILDFVSVFCVFYLAISTLLSFFLMLSPYVMILISDLRVLATAAVPTDPAAASHAHT